MANKYAVVRTDALQGTDARHSIVSVKYQPLVSNVATDTAIENGNFVKLGALIDGEREIRTSVTPAASDGLHEVALIATPEVMYDERIRNLDEFRNEAGKIARGYILHSGDMFGVTAEALAFATDEETDGVVGSVVELQAGTKLKVVKAATGATSGSTVIGSIWAIETVGRYTYYVIKVD